jgi:hypothetical protein
MDRSPLRRPQRGVAVRLALAGCLLVVGGAVPAGAAPLTRSGWSPDWQTVTPGPAGAAAAGTAVARDRRSGAIYVAGHVAGAAGGTDVVVVKYSAAGAQKWMKTYVGTKAAAATAIDAAVDRAGDVVVLARAGNTGTGLDWVVLKFAPDGTQIWARTVAGAGSSRDQPSSLAISPSGAIYAAGALGVARRGRDAALVKLTPAGTVSWRRFVDGPAHADDRFSSLGLDAAGRVFAAGAVGQGGSQSACLIAAYTPAGRRLWTTTWRGAAPGHDAVNDLAVTPSGKTYAVGSSGSAGSTRATIRHCDATGRFVWQASYHTKSAGRTWFAAVALAPGGHVIATGTIVEASSGDSNIVTVGFAPGGPSLWQRTWTTPHGPGAVSPDTAVGVAVDGGGRVFVAGTVGDGTRRSLDYAVLRYTAAGRDVWSGPRTWNGGAGDDRAFDLVLALRGIVVTGQAATSAGPGAIATVEFPY